MFSKILVPVDGSESSWRALREAVALAEKFDGKLFVVTVIQPYNNAALLAVPLDRNIISQSNEELERIGGEVLKMAKEIAGENADRIDYKLEVGHPSERIIALVKKLECDAVVIGSRGLSGIAEFFLGSVSSKVVQYANVPVLVVK